jgi:3-oxoacid CoA-transferase B subunit
MIPGKLVKGMGGAMDLVAGVRRVVVVMDHANKAGVSKVLKECTLPLTGKECIDLVITNLGVFEVERGKGMILIERAEDVSVEEIRDKTEAEFRVAENLGVLN